MTPTDAPLRLDWSVDRLEPDKMRVLALLLDDPNPIHVDAAAAARLGLGERQVNQGPCNVALMVNMARSALPDAAVRELDVRLTGSALAGDAVDVEGRLVASDAEAGTLVYEVSASVRGGATIVEGHMTLERRDR